MNLEQSPDEINADVKMYFTWLGYYVTWDFNSRNQESWHEIYKDGKLICQIDMGVPIGAIQRDLSRLYIKKDPDSPYDYKITGPDTPEFKELLKDVYYT